MGIDLIGNLTVIDAIADNVQRGLDQRGYSLAAELFGHYRTAGGTTFELSPDQVRNDAAIVREMETLHYTFERDIPALVKDMPRGLIPLDERLFSNTIRTLSEPLRVALGDIRLYGRFVVELIREKTDDYAIDLVRPLGPGKVTWHIGDAALGSVVGDVYSWRDPDNDYDLNFDSVGVDWTLDVDQDFVQVLERNGRASPFEVRCEWSTVLDVDAQRVDNKHERKKCGRPCKDESLSPCDRWVWAYPDEPPPPCRDHDDPPAP